MEKIIFWGALAAVLLLAAGRIGAVPTGLDSLNQAGRGPVVISEVMAANHVTLLDEDDDPSDWIELWNSSNAPVNLRNWSLTDDPTRPDKWLLRDITLVPDERLVIFASGKNRTRIEVDDDTGLPGALHTNFRLNADGGFVALYPPTTRRFLDGTSVTYPALHPDQAFGVGDGRDFGFLAVPTPGQPNGAVDLLSPARSVLFSHSRGLYDAPFTLTLDAPDRDASIYYTVDSRWPDIQASPHYTGALTIDRTTVVRAMAVAPGRAPSSVTTHTFVFPAQVTQQSATPPGAPATWGTHQLDFGGYQAGEPVVADYEMDPQIVADPTFGAQLSDAFAALPVLSLSGGDGIWELYANPQGRGREVEQPVAVELFDPQGREPGFAVDAGTRIQGGAGRWEFMPKHSFRLFFRSDYGAPQLAYPIFPNSPAQSFNTLILRAGTDRGFAGHPPAPETVNDHRQDTMTRDQWARATQLEMTGVGVHGRYVHLFLNGLYWGIYNLVEKPDADYWATYFGGVPADYGVVSHSGPVDGPLDRFNVLRQLAEEGGLADPARYATMMEFVDPVQFSDYLILNWYAGNTDWPENNWYVGAHYPAGPNLFLEWDAEMTWLDGAQIFLGGEGWEGAPFPNVIKQVFDALMENPDFRMLLADRFYALTKPGAPLADTQAQARWLDINAELEPAIVAESTRWGDTRYAAPITPADWAQARDNVLSQMTGNSEKLLDQARAVGYYPAVEPPLFSVDAAEFDAPLALTMAPADGPIYYTVDGHDPRADGGAIAPSAQLYNAPIPIDAATRVRARRLDGDVWSPLAERFYYPVGQQSDVRITEIMYNPPDGERYEFVELTNLGDLPADLSGAYFTGIDFRFPWYRTLAPGESMAIAADFKRFRELHPDAEIGGIFTGKLSDRGEELALYDRQGTLLDGVAYEDADGWPLSADGTGDSLELIDPDGDSSNPRHWRASGEINGTPGRYPHDQ